MKMKQGILTQITSINGALRRTSVLYSEWSRKHDINHFAMKILYVLVTEGPATQKKISEENKLSKQTVNTIVTALKENEYVVLVNCAGDKREKTVELTEKGLDYATKLLDPLFQIEERIIKKMGNQNVRQLIELMTIYSDIMEKEMQNKEAAEND